MPEMISKKQLRKAITARLGKISPEEQAEVSKDVCCRIAVLPQYKKAQRIMAFLSMPGEICLDSLLDQAIREGRHVYVPRCLSRGVMEAVRLDSVSTAVNGKYGIRTAPAENLSASPDTLDLILVPGVAFDEKGWRLGHGAAFYDRFLPKAQQASWIGIVWDMQIVPTVPKESHDVCIPFILTEQRYIITHWK